MMVSSLALGVIAELSRYVSRGVDIRFNGYAVGFAYIDPGGLCRSHGFLNRSSMHLMSWITSWSLSSWLWATPETLVVETLLISVGWGYMVFFMLVVEPVFWLW